MRVIGGDLGGRNFEAVPGHRTHPMSEKIRGALFNSLGDINGLSVLDAYAGTGALSIEAISRGAKSAVAIELDQNANRTIHENVELLGLVDKISPVRAAVKSWSRRHQNEQFDIVLLDPPYNNFDPKDLLNLRKHVKKGGLIVLSLPPRTGFQFSESNQELLMHKNYGDADLFFYRQK
jgi:16S rRNA (guanine966-N2)-methyltransferase